MVIKISCAKIENLEKKKKICNSDSKINLIRIGYWENIVIENYQKSRKRKQGKLIKDMEYIWSPSSNHDGTKIGLTGETLQKTYSNLKSRKRNYHGIRKSLSGSCKMSKNQRKQNLGFHTSSMKSDFFNSTNIQILLTVSREQVREAHTQLHIVENKNQAINP